MSIIHVSKIDMEPLHLKLIKPARKEESKFYQKYIVIKREKVGGLFAKFMKAVFNADIGPREIETFTSTLDGMMNLQGLHFFVVNLDEKEGQEAMIKYWLLKGYSREEIEKCIPGFKDETHDQAKDKS